MENARVLRKELAILAAMLVIGLLLLPIAVYVVGQNVVGEYGPNLDVLNLMTAIWAAVARFSVPAWLFIASPYLGVQLLRVAKSQWRKA
jgi:uncharacterized membrane protein YraQ (UPF0718 family)